MVKLNLIVAKKKYTGLESIKRNTLKQLVYSLISTLLISIILLLFKNHLDITLTNMLLFSSIIFFILFCSIYIYFNFFHNHSSVDMTKRKLAKDQELIALKTVEKYRREFFGNVSHELKTPIFNIQGYVETLIDGALYDKNVNKKYLKRTIKSVDRLIYIIQDLESIAQLESEELNLEITDWELKLLINEIIDQFEIKAKQKKIRLVYDKQSINLLVYADKGKISQVLSNLISNSIKYGKKNGITKISCYQSKTKCWVSVKDNGIGIAEKNRKRLFERFYRVDKSRSREQGGTGLGLAIAKHIMEAHNETITVKSTVEKGTEFIFSIKLSKHNRN